MAPSRLRRRLAFGAPIAEAVSRYSKVAAYNPWSQYGGPSTSRGSDPYAPVQRGGYGHQPLIHTFETQSSCMRRCALPCVVQNVEDLMMPRWICPSQTPQDYPGMAIAKPPVTTSIAKAMDNQYLLLLVPLLLILIIILIIVWIRRSSRNSSDDITV